MSWPEHAGTGTETAPNAAQLAAAAETPAAVECLFCDEPAQPEHSPCCSSHNKPLCCEHYCRAHFLELNPCDPAQHAREAKS